MFHTEKGTAENLASRSYLRGRLFSPKSASAVPFVCQAHNKSGGSLGLMLRTGATRAPTTPNFRLILSVCKRARVRCICFPSHVARLLLCLSSGTASQEHSSG